MGKQRYKAFRAYDTGKLKGFLDNLFRKTPRDHYIVKIVAKEIPNDVFFDLLEKYQSKIEWYRREKSLIFVLEDYDPDEIPEWLVVAPSELEASDIIDFEEIERDLNY
jgi:hypothetical protein